MFICFEDLLSCLVIRSCFVWTSAEHTITQTWLNPPIHSSMVLVTRHVGVFDLLVLLINRTCVPTHSDVPIIKQHMSQCMFSLHCCIIKFYYYVFPFIKGGISWYIFICRYYKATYVTVYVFFTLLHHKVLQLMYNVFPFIKGGIYIYIYILCFSLWWILFSSASQMAAELF